MHIENVLQFPIQRGVEAISLREMAALVRDV